MQLSHSSIYFLLVRRGYVDGDCQVLGRKILGDARSYEHILCFRMSCRRAYGSLPVCVIFRSSILVRWHSNGSSFMLQLLMEVTLTCFVGRRNILLVRHPVCDLNTCDGTLQTLDARHIELFLSDGYKNGTWEYEMVGSHDIKKHADGASGGIFDIKHLKDPSTLWNEDYLVLGWIL